MAELTIDELKGFLLRAVGEDETIDLSGDILDAPSPTWASTRSPSSPRRARWNSTSSSSSGTTTPPASTRPRTSSTCSTAA